jgi:hypothetical protein
MHLIGQSTADGKGRADPVENEAGELISPAQLSRLSTKVVLRIFVALFSKT